MKLAVHHLGRIEDATFDLRPLTIFVGPNGTNKSWTAYAARGLLHWLSRGGGGHHAFPKPLGAMGDLVAHPPAPPGNLPFDLTRNEVHLRRPWVFACPHVLDVVLGTKRKGDASATLTVEPADLADGVGTRVSVTPDRDVARIVVYDAEGAPVGSAVARGDAVERAGALAAETLLASTFGTLAPFPIERTELSMLSTGVIYERSLVVYDYTSMMQSIPGTRNAATLLAAAAERIGGVRVHMDDFMRLHYSAGGRDLSFHETASMTRSLAPIALYLRHLARRWDWVFVDEPEMNAHPAAQLQIAELLAAMVRAGIRVLLTTHSPYLVDHLSNLMAAHALPPSERSALASSFTLPEVDAILDPADVAAYRFDDAGDRVVVSDILDRSGPSIDVGTFAAVTDHLASVYGAILDARRQRRTG